VVAPPKLGRRHVGHRGEVLCVRRLRGREPGALREMLEHELANRLEEV
jgi:hypothetical protein